MTCCTSNVNPPSRFRGYDVQTLSFEFAAFEYPTPQLTF